jgi:hypothetical protein
MSTSVFIESLILDLVRLGWTSSHSHPFAGIASRQFDTAVGAKVAHLYAVPSSSNREQVVVVADYSSEGRNALASMCDVLSVSSSTEERNAIASRLTAEVVERVNQTYARGLYLRHAMPADA